MQLEHLVVLVVVMVMVMLVIYAVLSCHTTSLHVHHATCVNVICLMHSVFGCGVQQCVELLLLAPSPTSAAMAYLTIYCYCFITRRGKENVFAGYNSRIY